MAGEKILIIEDEKPLIKVLSYNLEKEGYRVFAATDGQTGLALFSKEKPALVLLDLMLPKIDGFEFCKTIRKSSQTPILILTARREEVDRILGLELGADDYVVKPFSVRELMARIKAILRRSSPPSQAGPLLRAGELEVDIERYVVRIKEKSLPLTSKEFELLKCLLEAQGRVLSRDQLLEKAWGHERGLELDTRTVDQHIKRLRDKLGSEAARLITVKNIGYRLGID